jgi:hypothetical protein
MNIFKIAILTSLFAVLSACGDSGDNNDASTAVNNAASEMEAMTEEAREKAQEEAKKRAEELEALENQ